MLSSSVRDGGATSADRLTPDSHSLHEAAATDHAKAFN